MLGSHHLGHPYFACSLALLDGTRGAVVTDSGVCSEARRSKPASQPLYQWNTFQQVR